MAKYRRAKRFFLWLASQGLTMQIHVAETTQIFPFPSKCSHKDIVAQGIIA